MIIGRKSPLTGQLNHMDLDVTQEQLDRYSRREGYIQDIFPHLSADEREFLQTGYTPEDWDKIFQSEKEDQ